MKQDTILVLDFGSQYTQLIARRVRELDVYSEIYPYNIALEKIKAIQPKGIILSGSPASIYDKKAPLPDMGIFDLGLPILGICYGMQIVAEKFGGRVEKGDHREYGFTELNIIENDPLLKDLFKQEIVWMSHGDKLVKKPAGFKTVASTANSDFAVISNLEKKVWAIQFHPEVAHTKNGKVLIDNFVTDICGARQNWTPESYIKTTIEDIKNRVGNERVLCGVSGGVDSTVAAVLISKAVGDRLTCVFVDNGLLRLNEEKQVMEMFKKLGVKVTMISAAEEFLLRLKGVSDPEKKRKIIGNYFIEVFEKHTKTLKKKLGHFEFLAQGTLYPDLIESVSVKGPSAMIKSHHNVGGLPEKMEMKLLEPLKYLFKDEVREIGKKLGIQQDILWRQPFPGPGLAVRILGDITKERTMILKKADNIILEEIKKAGLYYKIWQSFGVLLPVKTVGVMGDLRTYENVLALRAVDSKDGMTAEWVKLPYEVLGSISSRVINEVKGVNRVVYDISNKPPATIEWE
jgi:GMP synthase (glutamine-hydrolysing)